MNDSIFVPSFGNRPTNLIGREEILARFRESLTSVPGSRERAILLLGQRGSGKTVLLLVLADMAKEASIITASPTVVTKDMNDRILEKLILSFEDILGKKKQKVAGANLSVMGFGAGIQLQNGSNVKQSFAGALSEICEKANDKGHPVLILIDETQPDTEELRKLVVAYQEMVGEGRDIFLVMAGLPETVSGVLNDHVLTFLNRATKIELPPLRIGDVEVYYRNAFSSLGILSEEDILHRLALETFGSPYLMQLIGHYATVMSDGDTVNNEIADRAILQASEDYKNDICKTAMASLSERDIDFLVAMSKDEGDSVISDITSRLGCSDAYVQTYKRRLVQSGVIRQPSRGRLSFTVPYMREYLRGLSGS